MPKVFGIESHTYCPRHLRENFLTHAGKYGFKRQAMKDWLKEVFNRVAYTPSVMEYVLAMEEMKKILM